MLSLPPHMTLHIPLELTYWSLPPSLGLISIIQRKQFVDEQQYEGWYGQPKYCLKISMQVAISFAVVFGLLVFCF